MKEREANRILEHLGLEPLHPSEGTVVRTPSSKAKVGRKNKKQAKK